MNSHTKSLLWLPFALKLNPHFLAGDCKSSTVCCLSSFAAVPCIILCALAQPTHLVLPLYRMPFLERMSVTPCLVFHQPRRQTLPFMFICLNVTHPSRPSEMPPSLICSRPNLSSPNLGFASVWFYLSYSSGDFMEEFWFPIIYPIVRLYFIRFHYECMPLMIMEFILCLIYLKVYINLVFYVLSFTFLEKSIVHMIGLLINQILCLSLRIPRM